MRPSDVTAAAVSGVVAVGVVVAVVVASAHSGHEPKVFEERTTPPADSRSSPDADAVTLDPEEPLVCMFDLDCLLHEVEVTGEGPAAVAPAVPA